MVSYMLYMPLSAIHPSQSSVVMVENALYTIISNVINNLHLILHGLHHSLDF